MGVEEGGTFSQDVASLPLLRGSQEESSVPFNFFILVLCLLRPHSLSLAATCVILPVLFAPLAAGGTGKPIWKTTSCMSSVITGRQRPPVPHIGSLMPRLAGQGQA